ESSSLVETAEHGFDRALALGLVRGIQVEAVFQLQGLAGEGNLHLAIAQQSDTLAPLSIVQHRADVHGIEESVMAKRTQRLELRPLPGQAFGESHEMYHAELEIRLPGVFHADGLLFSSGGGRINHFVSSAIA